MSNENLVTVKAEALKLVPYGFEFYDENNVKHMVQYSDELFVYSWYLFGAYNNVDYFATGNDESVSVNPTDYTAAVIVNIMNMLPTSIRIRKDKNGIWWSDEHYDEIPLSADPWPWAEIGEWRADK